MSINPFEEFLKCQNDFVYFAKNYLKILNPKLGLIPFELHSYQERLSKDYDQLSYVILKKFRQGGFTTLTALWGLWKCMFSSDQHIMFVSRNDREAIAVGKIVDTAINNLPDWLKPLMKIQQSHEKHFAGTNNVFCFYTCEAAKSKSLTYLIIDEAAFIGKMDEHWKAMYPTISCGGKVIVMSTVNGMGNWFQKTYYYAMEKKNAFKIFESSYDEHPDFAKEEWASDMKKNIGEKGWKQEVLCQFLYPDNVSKEVVTLTNPDLAACLKIIANKFKEKSSLTHEDSLTHQVIQEASERLGILSDKRDIYF